MLTVVDILKKTESWLRQRGVTSPRLDAELLLGHVLGLPRLKLYLMHDRPVDEAELAALRPLVKRRGDREPLAYLTGSVGFHTIDLIIKPGVLVPRPDTETLVDAAISWMDPEADPLFIADVGAGSGAVGLALATALPGARLYSTDVSPIAIEVTRANIHALELNQRAAALRGSLLGPIPDGRPIDWVVSNPPYIPSRTIPGLQPEVSQHEPRLALDGGRDGLDFYHALAKAGRKRVKQGLLVEVGHDQAPAVSKIFRDAGFTDISTWRDLAGIERVVGGRQPSASSH